MISLPAEGASGGIEVETHDRDGIRRLQVWVVLAQRRQDVLGPGEPIGLRLPIGDFRDRAAHQTHDEAKHLDRIRKFEHQECRTDVDRILQRGRQPRAGPSRVAMSVRIWT